MKTIPFLILLFCTASSVFAQERGLVRKGNELYTQKKYAEAAAAYQQALQKQPLFVPGAFNLGNALIQQKQYDAARKVMDNTVKNTDDPAVQSGAQYNKGNTYMSEQQWQQAVDAYKQSLRKNPQDADAKYNLSYALTKLKQQQQNGGGKDDKKNQDDKDNQQKKDKQDQGDQRNQQQKEGNKEQDQRRQQQPSKLSEQQADNMLKALQQDERKVQDKMQQGKATPVKLEKDW